MVSKSKHITSVKGEIVVVIGPNGYGKTTYLDNLKKSLEKKGENVLFIPSEIKLLDEMKDTVDTSQAMEFLLQEILETPEYVAKRESLFAEADKIISDSLSLMNGILDEVLDINDSVSHEVRGSIPLCSTKYLQVRTQILACFHVEQM